MMETRILKKQALGTLLERIRGGGFRVLAPSKSDGQVVFKEVSKLADVDCDAIQTTLSPKSAVFPRCEELVNYTFTAKDVRIEDREFQATPTVLFGVRPCDARSFAVLNSVFSWDVKDVFFQKRLEATTVIGMSCTKADDYCFCTSVGGSPGDTSGSDLSLTLLSSGDYLAEVVTEKGSKIVSLAGDLFGPAGKVNKDELLPKIPVKFDVKELTGKLPGMFTQNEVWAEQAMRCIGCSTCAFVCPCCVCFDMQDEANRQGGTRLRCWDSCGQGLFTQHASGHNPRHSQGDRWRQRIMHKFSYFPDRLDYIACVGCGRCSRSCPADMNLLEHLESLVEAK